MPCCNKMAATLIIAPTKAALVMLIFDLIMLMLSPPPNFGVPNLHQLRSHHKSK